MLLEGCPSSLVLLAFVYRAWSQQLTLCSVSVPVSILSLDSMLQSPPGFPGPTALTFPHLSGEVGDLSSTFPPWGRLPSIGAHLSQHLDGRSFHGVECLLPALSDEQGTPLPVFVLQLL